MATPNRSLIDIDTEDIRRTANTLARKLSKEADSIAHEIAESTGVPVWDVYDTKLSSLIESGIISEENGFGRVGIIRLVPRVDRSTMWTGRYSARKDRITVRVPAGKTLLELASDVRKNAHNIYYVLVHEVTHAYDPGARVRDIDYEDRPTEVRAKARQVAEETARIAKKHPPEPGENPSQWLSRILSKSRYWRQVEKSRNEDSQRLILQYVVGHLQSKGLV